MRLMRIVKVAVNKMGAELFHRDFGADWPTCDRIFLCNTSSYRNIGDHAITLAEIQFLKKYFPDKKIIEITSEQWRSMSSSAVKQYIKDEDVFFIHGGGYFGTQWGGGEEASAIDLMSRFPNNRYFVFPQTVFFSNNSFGKKTRDQREKFYRKIPNLTLFVREKQSYTLAEEMNCFKGGVYLFPDIVLSLDKSDLNYKRQGILLCFRNDEERDAGCIVDDLSGLLTDRGYAVSNTDTVAPKDFPFEDRFIVVENKIRQFASSELVVTDRLHAMIMCAISNTPCIALNNSNGKVFGVYDWISDLSYIQLCLNEGELLNMIEIMLDSCTHTQYEWHGLANEYDRMSMTIANLIH